MLTIRSIGLLSLVSWVTMLPALLWAAPREVVLFKDAALITEVSRFSLREDGGRQKVELALPQGTDPATFTCSLPPLSKLKLESVVWQGEPLLPEERLGELRSRLARAREERAALRGNLLALENQLIFWQTQAKGRAKNAGEAASLEGLVAKNSRKALREKLLLEPEVAVLDRRIRQIEEEIGKLSQSPDRRWRLVLSLSGPKVKEETLTYTYLASGCGWEKAYRIDARPAEGRLRVGREALVRQNTGRDWRQVALILAEGGFKTGRPEPGGVSPAAFPPAGRRADFVTAPVGLQTVPTNREVKIPISKAEWPALFVHYLKPRLATPALVTGRVTLTEPTYEAPGEAVFLWDGAYLGKGTFAFAGREGEITIGVDPLVRALSVSSGGQTEATGKEGPIANFSVRTEVKNDRDKPVWVVLEEDQPQSAGGGIKPPVFFDPPPCQEGEGRVFWRTVIPPAGSKSFRRDFSMPLSGEAAGPREEKTW